MSAAAPTTDFPAAERIRDFEESFWTEFFVASTKHKAVSLGQGFPDFPIPKFLKQAAVDAIEGDFNQYTRSPGHVRLVETISRHYSATLQHAIDPLRNVLTTVGAAESFHAITQSLIDRGDEVILFEPFFDFFIYQIRLAGGVPVGVPLVGSAAVSTADAWRLDDDALERAITPRTKMIVLNTPMNPLGKVFNRAETEHVAALAKKYNLLVISDEVYDRLVYDDVEMQHIATYPDMWERTLTIFSCGKTFCATGWKIGWTIGPEHLVSKMARAHQYNMFTICTPLQEAVAVAFDDPECAAFFVELRRSHQAKRDRFCAILRDVGFNPIVPSGSYFVNVDISDVQVDFPVEDLTGSCGETSRDFVMCRFLIREIGVAAIPVSAFYTREHKHLGENTIRFCFCKKDETLDEAGRRLQKLKAFIVR